MAQEYKVVQFKKGDFQDNYGNYWCDMALEGVSEPVRIVVKDPMEYKDGMTLYGKITEETSKAGKSYQRFRREQREETHYTKQGNQDKPGEEYWADKQAQIRAQWAIGQSLSKFEENCYQATDADRVTLLANIEDFAKELYVMVDNVKNSDIEAQLGLGRAVADNVDKGTPLDEIIEDDEKPIDLKDIPF